MGQTINLSKIPQPLLIEPLHLTDNIVLSLSIRFHPDGEPIDSIIHYHPKDEGIFDNEDVGHLMLDVWSISEPDRLIANVTLLAEEDLFAVRDIYVDPEWRNRGLISYMLANAQNLSGWSRIITGLEWVNVW